MTSANSMVSFTFRDTEIYLLFLVDPELCEAVLGLPSDYDVLHHDVESKHDHSRSQDSKRTYD